MAWNRPNAAKQPTVKKDEARAPSKVKGAVAGLVTVCALGGVCMLFLVGPKQPRNERPNRNRGLIKEVKPAATPRVVEGNDPEPDPNARPTRPGQRVNGYVMLPNGKIHKMTGSAPTNCVVRGEYAIFPHASENIIAGLLSIKPGMSVIGNARDYNGKFTENFLKSLTVPIIVSKDDPEDVKELKRAVNEAKIELKAAHDRGENIEDIIAKARGEMQDLARYKLDLKREVSSYAHREAVTPEDVDTYLKAANMMLEAKGVAPLEDEPFTRIKLKMKESWENEQ